MRLSVRFDLFVNFNTRVWFWAKFKNFIDDISSKFEPSEGRFYVDNNICFHLQSTEQFIKSKIIDYNIKRAFRYTFTVLSKNDLHNQLFSSSVSVKKVWQAILSSIENIISLNSNDPVNQLFKRHLFFP